MAKKTKIQKLERGLEEVKVLVKEFKKRNGNSSIHIPNKDILFLLLTRSMDSDRRIARLEGILKIIVPIVLAGIGITAYGVL